MIVKKLDSIQSDVSKMKKVLKCLVKKQEEMDKRSFSVDSSEYKVQ